ncbi:MAG: DUF308 domain-containing protein [Candidatus Acidiferrales bacterium]
MPIEGQSLLTQFGPLYKGEQGTQKSDVMFAPLSRTVTIKFQVQDPNGYFLPNIRRDNFAVYEDGVRQRDISVDVEHAPITVALLLEYGGRYHELNQSTGREVAQIARLFMDRLRNDDKVGIFTYSDKLQTLADFNQGLGWLLVFSAGAHFVFAWHARATRGAIWEVLVGILYLLVGGYMLINPVLGMVSLTFAMAVYFVVEAALEFVLSFRLRPMPGSGWLLFDGTVTAILAVIIFATWPLSSAWTLGTLAGISMLFSGVARLMLSLAARRAVTELT